MRGGGGSQARGELKFPTFHTHLLGEFRYDPFAPPPHFMFLMAWPTMWLAWLKPSIATVTFSFGSVFAGCFRKPKQYMRFHSMFAELLAGPDASSA